LTYKSNNFVDTPVYYDEPANLRITYSFFLSIVHASSSYHSDCCWSTTIKAKIVSFSSKTNNESLLISSLKCDFNGYCSSHWLLFSCCIIDFASSTIVKIVGKSSTVPNLIIRGSPLYFILFNMVCIIVSFLFVLFSKFCFNFFNSCFYTVSSLFSLLTKACVNLSLVCLLNFPLTVKLLSFWNDLIASSNSLSKRLDLLLD